MSIVAHITKSCSSQPIITWLRKYGSLHLLEDSSTDFISACAQVFINGNWIGVVEEPNNLINKIYIHRQLALLPIYMSAHWDKRNNQIVLYSDGGRLTRPIFMLEDELPSYERMRDNIISGDFTWDELITGMNKKGIKDFNPNNCKIYDTQELYSGNDKDALVNKRAIIQYMDTAEEEAALIAMTADDLGKGKYTHLEIHPSLILGVMGNQIVFPENNQLPRDLFSCGQSKQAVSLYHSNYQNRIDKMGVVLNYGQMPLVKSRYLEYIHHEEHPYGENAIVAIMCYGGYNVEDAILFNEGSVKRGLFRTTYLNMYETHEESSKVGNSVVDSHFANIESENVIGTRPGYDYSDLDKHGLIKENTKLDDKKVLIGKVTTDLSNPDISVDASIVPKKGQLGFVDKSFITEGEEGTRLAKVRIREERTPAIGDKFCSRCGQKGTVGLVIPERDMPYTKDGVRPDLIINPHALPSRMTIGQLVECLIGKTCAIYGAYGDCTAFVNKGPKHERFGKLLQAEGFHSSGNEILYNGMTGEQLRTEIFIGPTYYMRLKHMVKDKINYRALGPRTLLTRQTVQGRANDGGLRIGEMERDGVIAHGAAGFLQESLMVRGDDYYMAICNQTGTIAIYNNTLNLFLSPMADGPIKFNGSLDGNLNIENISKYGRSFSIVRVPYAFKLLMQELQVMNIQMRVITEANIDQLQSLSYSDNINKLVFDGANIADLIAANKERLEDLTQEEMPQQNYSAVPAPPELQTQQNYSAVPAPPEFQTQSEAPVVFDDPFADDPFADDPFADDKVVTSFVPKDFKMELPDVQNIKTPDSLPATSPTYGIPAQTISASQSPDSLPATSPTYGIPEEKTPSVPTVKATIEVPAGQEGQFTVTSKGPPTTPPPPPPPPPSEPEVVTDEEPNTAEEGSNVTDAKVSQEERPDEIPEKELDDTAATKTIKFG